MSEVKSLKFIYHGGQYVREMQRRIAREVIIYLIVNKCLLGVLLDAVPDSEITSIVAITEFHVLELLDEVVMTMCMFCVDTAPRGGMLRCRFHDE